MTESNLATQQNGQHQRALEENERRLRLALKSGKLGYWKLDLVSRQLETSEICRENFGRDPRSFFSYDDLQAAVHPDDRVRMGAAVARAISENSDYDIQYRVVKPDGSIGWIMVRGHPELDAGGRPGMFGISLDITESKMLTEQLAFSEASLRLATEAAEIGTWDLDLTTGILTWSDRTKKMFGISTHRPISMKDFYDGLHPDDLPATTKHLHPLSIRNGVPPTMWNIAR